MKIKLNSKTYFQTGLELADLHEDEEALVFFNKTDDYQGQLNRLILLYRRHDLNYATEFLFDFYRRYGKEYNVLPDVYYAMGKEGKNLVAKLFPQGVSRDKTKHNAVKSKTVHFEREDDLDYGEDFEEDYDEFFAENADSDITVVGSNEYLDGLRNRMERAFAEGNVAEGQKYVDEILDRQSDYLPFAELKIFMLNVLDKREEARAIADRIYRENLSPQVAFLCADLFSDDKEKCGYMLSSLLGRCDELEEFHLCGCVSLASNVAKDDALAAKFADYLYRYYESFHFETLRSCAISFYNNGETEKGKDALKTLLCYLPEDIFAHALLEYFSAHDNAGKGNTLRFGFYCLDFYALPQQVLAYFLFEAVKESKTTDRTFWLLKLICTALKQETVNKEPVCNRFWLMKVLLREDLTAHKNFLPFAEEILASVYSDAEVKGVLLNHLAEQGYDKPLLVNYAFTSLYTLDMSLIYGAEKSLQSLLCAVAVRLRLTEKNLPLVVATCQNIRNKSGEALSDLSLAKEVADMIGQR